tara:strand:+ start:1848 stop:2081 length:234 start_codon:yes stop_codon:yes gene_type:complete
MDRYTRLQRQELESFGYVVRSEKEMDAMDDKLKENSKVNKPISEKPNKVKPVVKAEADKPDGAETDDEYAYLDDLET